MGWIGRFAIRTVARKGLRFVGEVRTEDAQTLQAAALPLPDRPAIAVLPFGLDVRQACRDLRRRR